MNDIVTEFDVPVVVTEPTMNVLAEEWRSIPTWPEYEASSLGRIRRIKASRGARAGKVLTPRRWDGHLKVALSRNCKPTTQWVHRLVALAFLGYPDDPSKEVAHDDNDGTNNLPGNLRWDTRAGNSADRVRHGTHIRGEANPSAKLTEEAVTFIRAALLSGRARRSLASEHGVGVATIDDIAARRSWRHVK